MAAEQRDETPVRWMARGAAAGLAATLLLSALSRLVPGLWNEQGGKRGERDALLPGDPFDPAQVAEWQARAQAPAAFQPSQLGTELPAHGGPPGATPAGALVEPQAPGPEGLAEQFAFKTAAGLFGRDISAAMRPIGKGVHLGYGSSWGMLYGLLEASWRLPPSLFGPLYGLLVYVVGPATLVPMMKLMRPVHREPRGRAAFLLAGHLVYGAALAKAFQALTSTAHAQPDDPLHVRHGD